METIGKNEITHLEKSDSVPVFKLVKNPVFGEKIAGTERFSLSIEHECIIFYIYPEINRIESVYNRISVIEQALEFSEVEIDNGRIIVKIPIHEVGRILI